MSLFVKKALIVLAIVLFFGLGDCKDKSYYDILGVPKQAS